MHGRMDLRIVETLANIRKISNRKGKRTTFPLANLFCRKATQTHSVYFLWTLLQIVASLVFATTPADGYCYGTARACRDSSLCASQFGGRHVSLDKPCQGVSWCCSAFSAQVHCMVQHGCSWQAGNCDPSQDNTTTRYNPTATGLCEGQSTSSTVGMTVQCETVYDDSGGNETTGCTYDANCGTSSGKPPDCAELNNQYRCCFKLGCE